MAFQTGPITLDSHVYDMTGISNYTPGNGVDLGPVGDLLLVDFERDVQIYKELRHGSTPSEASIDGSGCILSFSLIEYDAAAMKVFTQQVRPSGQNNNFHGFEAGVNYKLGRLLGSNELLSLLVADENDPTNHPMFYIARAVVARTQGMSFTMAERNLMSPAVIDIIGLYDTTSAGPFLFGDVTGFPSLGGD